MSLNQLSSFPLFIQAVLFVIIFVLLALFFTYINIGLLRFHNYRRSKLNDRYGPLFQNLLIQQVIANDDKGQEHFSKTIEELKKFNLKNNEIRQVLIQQIFHLNTQLSGQTKQALNRIYVELGLQDLAMVRLRSPDSQALVLAIKELMEMRIYDARLNADEFLLHDNLYVREISRRYIISLKNNGISLVFNGLNEPLSGMEQLELFKVITGKEYNEIPDFSQWIRLENEQTLVSLCIKLSVYFQQFASVQSIEQLVLEVPRELKKECVSALGKLMQAHSEEILVHIYDEQIHEIKLEILKAIGNIGSGESLSFLKYIFDHEPIVELKKYAAKAIINHNKQGSSLLKNLYLRSSQDDKIILNHAASSYIQY